VLVPSKLSKFKGQANGEVVWINCDLAKLHSFFAGHTFVFNHNRLAFATPHGPIPFGATIDENVKKWGLSLLSENSKDPDMAEFKKWTIEVYDSLMIDLIFENQVAWMHLEDRPDDRMTRDEVRKKYYKGGKSGFYRLPRTKDVVDATTGAKTKVQIGDLFKSEIKHVSQEGKVAEACPLNVYLVQDDGKPDSELIEVDPNTLKPTGKKQIVKEGKPKIVDDKYHNTYGFMVVEIKSIWFVADGFGPGTEISQICEMTAPQYRPQTQIVELPKSKPRFQRVTPLAASVAAPLNASIASTTTN
jgi:hypothetical protein